MECPKQIFLSYIDDGLYKKSNNNNNNKCIESKIQNNTQKNVSSILVVPVQVYQLFYISKILLLKKETCVNVPKRK